MIWLTENLHFSWKILYVKCFLYTFKYSASYNNKNNNIITIAMYTQKELAKATN